MIKKPMLSGTLENIDKLKFPLLASPKLDGIRCLMIDGKCVSRTFKAIPNLFIRTWMEKTLSDGFDGELISRNVDGSIRSFNEIQGDVMRAAGEPNFEFQVFDLVSKSLIMPFGTRYECLKAMVGGMVLSGVNHISVVDHVLIENTQELDEYEEKCLSEGYEGIMVRSIDGPYKCGRSTEKEGHLLKVKRFFDSEAEVIGFEEQQENTNEAEKDNFGKTKRSSHKDGMVGKNTLGKFLVREVGNTPWKGQEFAIGTGEGLTQELRQEIWNNRDLYLNKFVTYKYQKHGIKDLPRLPIWKGFRDERDIL